MREKHFQASWLVVALLLGGCAGVMERLEGLGSSGGATAQATPADGLREALRVGIDRAVSHLARADGYLGNPQVRIPVPPKIDKLAQALRRVGADRVVDEFVTSMNRAAEAAAPLAKRVFFDSIREITFDDAMAILRGHQHEATDFLRKHAGPRLAELFRPIVTEKLDAVGATRRFNELVDRASALPFVQRPVFELDQYVTEEGLDGLFLTLGQEEERIRKDPLARTTELLRRFFGQGGR